MLSLRKKTYLIILFATGIFLLCVCGVIWQTTDSSLKIFQYESAEEQLALVERILGREIENMSRTQADWAHWDDTYVFMSDRNEAYIDSNLNDESLALIGVHIMAFVDNAGDVVFAKQVYGGAPETDSPPVQFMKHFQGESELLRFDDSISVRHGILTLPDSMFLVSSQPILMSDGKGPRRGTLVFARYVDQQYADMLSTLAGISVRIAPYGFAGSSDSESLAVASQSDTYAHSYSRADHTTLPVDHPGRGLHQPLGSTGGILSQLRQRQRCPSAQRFRSLCERHGAVMEA